MLRSKRNYLGALLLGAGLLVGEGLFTHSTFAEVTLQESKVFRGKILQLMFSPRGEVDGIVLSSNNAVVQFPPTALCDPRALNKGDEVSVEGFLLTNKPNPVLNHVKITKNNSVVVDDTPESPGSMNRRPGKACQCPCQSPQAGEAALPVPQQAPFEETPQVLPEAPLTSEVTPPPPSSPEEPDEIGIILETPPAPNFAPITSDKAPLLAVSTRPDGRVDRIVLKDGTTVQLPRRTTLKFDEFKSSEPLNVTGYGTSFDSHGSFIHATNITTGKDHSVLEVIGSDEKWDTVKGKISKALVDPNGRVNGFILDNGTSVRTPPLAPEQSQIIQLGKELEATGLAAHDSIFSEAVKVGGRTLQFEPFLIGQRWGGQQAGVSAAGELAPTQKGEALFLKDQSKIKKIFKNPAGESDLLFMEDGTQVRVPRRTQEIFGPGLSEGRSIIVSGRGGISPFGTVIEAESIHFLG